MFQTVLNTAQGLSIKEVLICSAVSLVAGLVIALLFQYKNKMTKGLAMTLCLLPVLVQMVIMLVNGNLGTGVAIMGAFSLVRFRSNPGSAKDICSVFFAMAIGLATGMGYLTFAISMLIIVGIAYFIMVTVKFGEEKTVAKQLKITIPENLNYTDVFDDLFEKYTTKAELQKVKTTNMGSMYELTYVIQLKSDNEEKSFLDEIRCRNGNLTIMCGRMSDSRDSL